MEEKVIRPGEKTRLQDDFYTNLNYDFLKKEKLPEGYASVDTIGKISLETEDQIRDMLKEITSDKGYAKLKPGSDEWKVATFYRMAANMKEISWA